jgi:hypothetical protein
MLVVVRRMEMQRFLGTFKKTEGLGKQAQALTSTFWPDEAPSISIFWATVVRFLVCLKRFCTISAIFRTISIHVYAQEVFLSKHSSISAGTERFLYEVDSGRRMHRGSDGFQKPHTELSTTFGWLDLEAPGGKSGLWSSLISNGCRSVCANRWGAMRRV